MFKDNPRDINWTLIIRAPYIVSKKWRLLTLSTSRHVYLYCFVNVVITNSIQNQVQWQNTKQKQSKHGFLRWKKNPPAFLEVFIKPINNSVKNIYLLEKKCLTIIVYYNSYKTCVLKILFKRLKIWTFFHKNYVYF